MRFKYLPYDFIPVDSVDASLSFKDKGELSGVLKVGLEVKTPMVAIREESNTSVTPTGRTIPGSSLKGMLRNAAEIIWNDHLSVLDKNAATDKRVPDEWKNEEITIDRHGPVSHLFGFATAKRGEKDTRETDSKHNNSTLGSRLFFSDAILEGSLKSAKCIWKKHTLSSPQGLSVGFYKDKGKSAGRKVYLSGATVDVSRKLTSIGNVTLDAASKDYIGINKGNNRPQGNSSSDLLIMPGNRYSFTIKFQQLTEQELADVIRLIELMPERHHALGRGKPLGLGRVKLVADAIQVYDKQSFFTLSNKELSGTLSKNEILQKASNPYQRKMDQYCELLNGAMFHKQKAYNQPGAPAKPYRHLKISSQHSSVSGNTSSSQQQKKEMPVKNNGVKPSNVRADKGKKHISGGSGYSNNSVAEAFLRANSINENKGNQKGKK